MTTKGSKLIAVVVLAMSASCGTGRSARRGGLPNEEVAKLPPAIASAYRLFAQKCSRCHTLARPLTADIDDASHWGRYVERMRRQRGSGISPADAAKILTFLEYYSARRLEKERKEARP